MKKLIVLLGPNAVGKSSVCKALLDQCPGSAMVDADWCRQINPSPFTNATKETVTNNLYDLISNYLMCSEIQWVFFPYSIHGEQEGIFRRICSMLDLDGLHVQIHTIVLKASMEEILSRGKADGRDREQIEQGIMQTFALYDDLELPCIDTTDLTIHQAAEAVLAQIGPVPSHLPKKKRNLRPLLALLAVPVILMGFLLGRCTAPEPFAETTDPVSRQSTEAVTQTTEFAETVALPTAETTQATLPPTEETEPPIPTEETEPPIPTEETESSLPTETATPETTAETSPVMDYIVNKNSLKFHHPDCESVGKMKESNKEYFTGTREELLERGCDPCGNCNP